jgi:L-fuconolactonase
MRIDSHHHLWHFDPGEFGWIPEHMGVLRRDFLPIALEHECQAARVDGTVAVQARQSLEETRWLLGIAGQSSVLGVVGWAPVTAPDFAATLDELRQHSRLKGLRHIVQSEPDGFLMRPSFQEGIRRLKEFGLVYDLLLYARQLPEAIRFVDAHPSQPFVLDHLGKPQIASAEIETWSKFLRELARRPNVCCKVSGLVTEADPFAWSAEQLKPYLDSALESFGPKRLMIGTDWPVCTVGCSYQEWWTTIENWIAPLSASERADILGLTAARVYRLQSPCGKARSGGNV